MKKFLLIASSFLLFSCTNTEEMETSKLSQEKQKAFEKASREGLTGETITYKCGSTSYVNPINVNPSFPYISTYEVLYQDFANMYGRNQIRLSEFVAQAIWGYGGPFSSTTQVFIGYNSYNDFLSSPGNFDFIQDFTYGQDADNATFYGDIFPYNGPMTNDAANTVYHYFKTQVDQYTSQGKQIVAVHLYTSSLLCIPNAKFIKMTLKVQ